MIALRLILLCFALGAACGALLGARRVVLGLVWRFLFTEHDRAQVRARWRRQARRRRWAISATLNSQKKETR
jgi:hypothetical protein